MYTELSTSLVVLDYALIMDAKERTGFTTRKSSIIHYSVRNIFSFSITVSLIACVKFIAGLSNVCVSLSDLGS